MKLQKLRNIGIVAHVDAGKTTLTERLLYFTGTHHKVGEVHHGNAVTDYMVQERERGITIASAAVTVGWRDHRINIIDTPGHIDFNIEVNRSLRVLDGAVVVFDSVAGVEPQSETNWRLADKYHVPRICVVNKMDRVGADYLRVIDMIRNRLGALPLVLQLPVFEEDLFVGLIDLVNMTLHRWSSEDGWEYLSEEISGDYLESALHYRALLEERIVELDDEIMASWLEGEPLDAAEVGRLIRLGTLAGSFVPVFCASAFKNVGVQMLLDAVVDYLPSPQDVKGTVGMDTNDGELIIESEEAGAFAALAFKVVNDKHGALTFVRVYRGSLEAGSRVLNSCSNSYERISRIYEMQADRKVAKDRISAGDIVALVGLKHTMTGDTLCAAEQPMILERISAPEPVMDIVLEPKTRQDYDRMSDALRSIVNEDPSLRLGAGSDGETLVSGMGELHLEIVVDRLKTDFGIDVNVGRPQVAYRETLTEMVEVKYLHKKQKGGAGQYAQVTLRFEPLEGDDIEFESQIVGAAIPREYIPSVEEGIRMAAMNGMLRGYPSGGFKAVLLDGAFHAQDSSQLAFSIAGREAFKEAARLAKPTLLEPLMAVEVVSPQEHVGDCIGDLMRRRGSIVQQTIRGETAVIAAEVPLSEMFGYIGDLRTLTAGRANYSMVFDRYVPVSEIIASKKAG
ncbi:translation elongation factor G [Hahella sp. CCB-MM4]|uniref:elongation factor G n=1 Tax=Hahella sp. (strain CCB-MM4) TaxID=1926491 RepID=UPI000B9AA0D7|nr:elongation factor G [Hahella sp. CCB-MM4]OZG73072.1 translation elongation factor G [Hahella sp. CCB-MM4]